MELATFVGPAVVAAIVDGIVTITGNGMNYRMQWRVGDENPALLVKLIAIRGHGGDKP